MIIFLGRKSKKSRLFIRVNLSIPPKSLSPRRWWLRSSPHIFFYLILFPCLSASIPWHKGLNSSSRHLSWQDPPHLFNARRSTKWLHIQFPPENFTHRPAHQLSRYFSVFSCTVKHIKIKNKRKFPQKPLTSNHQKLHYFPLNLANLLFFYRFSRSWQIWKAEKIP